MTKRVLGVAVSWRGEIFRAVGCIHCDNTGYKGRVAIMELFKMDSEMDELIARRATGREFREAARKTGFRSLAEDAVSRVLDGQTSLEEISRIVDLTDRIG